MLVAPLYAKHRGREKKKNEEWEIPWILRFCRIIRALKYIFPLMIIVLGLIDFFSTWKYCSIVPLFYISIFSSSLSSIVFIFIIYIFFFFILSVSDIPSLLFSGSDPKLKCAFFLLFCCLLFCISPFLLYSGCAIIFSFTTWIIETPDYIYVKWIYSHIIQYLQYDINMISKKYFRIARDRPLRYYIIMFKSLIMWLNIQLFQFLIKDYPRYINQWNDLVLMKQKENKSDNSDNKSDNNSDNTDDIIITHNDEEEHKYDICHQSSYSSSSLDTSSNTNTTTGGKSIRTGCCDFNFNTSINVAVSPLSRVNRYNKWCNEEYFKSLRSPFSILHEIVNSYPEEYIDFVNIYNLSQRHKYRYSNETFAEYSAKNNKINNKYLYTIIGAYIWIIVHTILFYICYYYGFRSYMSVDNIKYLEYIYLIEYCLLYLIYTLIIFNSLHCDRLLTIIQNTAWFNKDLHKIIYISLCGHLPSSISSNVNDNAIIIKNLQPFLYHHKRFIQIIIQHYMMLHVLNLILRHQWLSELIIDFLYGFHPFSNGNDQINMHIKNIIHGIDYKNRMDNEINELSISHSADSLNSNSDSDSDNIKMNHDNNNKMLLIPSENNLIGISKRIINTPNINDNINENNIKLINPHSLLNDFMEEKYMNKNKCSCHQDDQGFIRMWEELNLDALRLQYHSFKKQQNDSENNKDQKSHKKIMKSLEFYFDFIRSLHYTDDDNDED